MVEPPREGGGPHPPFGEGFFQRVVNVHWKKRPAKPAGINLLLPTIGADVIILSLPVVSRTVLKDGFIEFGS
jgi:hypothetical protein